MAGKQAFLSPGLTTHAADDCAWIWKKDRSSRENEGGCGKDEGGAWDVVGEVGEALGERT